MTIGIFTAAEEVAMNVDRYYAAMPGVVVDNEDPDGLHRVRVEVFGLIEKSAWALPITIGGGSPQRGGHVVPAVGADVIVWFIGGNVERPIYACGAWGQAQAGSEVPTDIKEFPAESAKIQSIEFDRLKITVDEREGKRAFRVENKLTGDFITIDLEAGGVHIKMTSAILLECLGAIDIDATQVTIVGRLVTPDSKDIA